LKGANAVMHVTHSRSATGRCAASGDAVVVRFLPESEPPELPADEPNSPDG
jgi:hypothetical protein